MALSPSRKAVDPSSVYPLPPRIHWTALLLAILSTEGLVLWLVPQPYRDFVVNLVTAAWPIYLCLWIRKIDDRSSSLYWAIASLVTGFLFSWLLWLVVIFEIREELLEHYNREEKISLRLNWFLTALFSFIYFQYELNKIYQQKTPKTERIIAGTERSTAEIETSLSA
jgi:hypothetical protein